MMQRIIYLIVLVVLFLGSLQAQTKAGTSVGEFLSIEPSGRIAGMGNAGVTLYGEPEAVYYNPGSIGYLQESGVQFTHSLWLADITYDYGVLALNIGSIGELYATVTALNSGEIDVRTVAQPLGTGERYTVSDIAVGVGFGRQISDKFSIGIQVNYVQETIWHSMLNAFSMSVGTLYQLSPDGLRLGASLSNFGTRGKFDGTDLRVLYDQNQATAGDNGNIPAELITQDYPLPVMFRVGLGLPVKLDEDNTITVAVDAFHPSENTESISLGGEYLFDHIVAVRAGYQNLFQQDSEVGLTLGAGIQYRVSGSLFTFDYAWASFGRLSDTHRIAIGLSF
jgi:opacity protein-like surface antigen